MTSSEPYTRQTLLDAWFPEVPPEEISVLGQNTMPAAYPLAGGGASYAATSTLENYPPSVTCLFAPIVAPTMTISTPNADLASANLALTSQSPTCTTSTTPKWPLIRHAADQIANKAAKKSRNWPMSAIDHFPDQMADFLSGTQVDDIVISSDDVDTFANSY